MNEYYVCSRLGSRLKRNVIFPINSPDHVDNPGVICQQSPIAQSLVFAEAPPVPVVVVGGAKCHLYPDGHSQWLLSTSTKAWSSSHVAAGSRHLVGEVKKHLYSISGA